MALKILLAVLMTFTIVRIVCDIRYYTDTKWYRDKKRAAKIGSIFDLEKWNMLSAMCIVVIGYNIL